MQINYSLKNNTVFRPYFGLNKTKRTYPKSDIRHYLINPDQQVKFVFYDPSDPGRTLDEKDIDDTFLAPTRTFYGRTTRDIKMLTEQDYPPEWFSETELERIKRNNITILDVACGRGKMVNELRKKHKVDTAFGIDLLLTGIQKDMKDAFLPRDARYTGFKDNSFDIIYCSNSLFSRSDEDRKARKQALEEIHRILKPGGLFRASKFVSSDIIKEIPGLILNDEPEHFPCVEYRKVY